MTKPVRMRLSRTKGAKLQDASRALNGLAAVNCARPGPYGNPHHVGPDMTAERACIHFKADLLRLGYIIGPRRTVTIADIRAKLAGKNLACFCKLSAKHCHVDTLLRVANDPALKAEVDHGH